jgi:hypothetical protein
MKLGTVIKGKCKDNERKFFLDDSEMLLASQQEIKNTWGKEHTPNGVLK